MALRQVRMELSPYKRAENLLPKKQKYGIINIVARNESPFKQGYLACLKAKGSYVNNPYWPEYKKEASAWFAGWNYCLLKHHRFSTKRRKKSRMHQGNRR